ncbi:MAG: hypothetical protein ACOVRN_04325, partial [Flavobacterium sp.]
SNSPRAGPTPLRNSIWVSSRLFIKKYLQGEVKYKIQNLFYVFASANKVVILLHKKINHE